MMAYRFFRSRVLPLIRATVVVCTQGHTGVACIVTEDRGGHWKSIGPPDSQVWTISIHP